MSTGDEDYYAVLELPRGASDAEIKKAYRKQALRWHPDKNPTQKKEAETRFKAISEAYEVLSDPQKRKLYDRYGKEGLQCRPTKSDTGRSGSGSYHFSNHFPNHNFTFHFRDPQEVFREFFSEFESSSRMSRSAMGRDPFFGNGFSNGFFFSTQLGGDSSRNVMFASTGNGGSFHGTVTTSTTRTVNGKRVTTHTVIKDGKETTTIEENGKVISQSVKMLQN